MIEILDELTEIPFEVFWDKFQEIDEGDWDKLGAQAIWMSMKEYQRKAAFMYLCLFCPMGSPKNHLKNFRK